MSLTLEWRRRIENWRNVMPSLFCRTLGTVDMSAYTTFEQFTAQQAALGDFQPMLPGTTWGAKWEYGWFHGELVLPEEAAGARIFLHVDVGAESAVYVNGRNAGGADWKHEELTLAMHGVPGTRYDVLVEGYGGHGDTPVRIGPVPPGRESVPEPAAVQRTLGTTTFGIWEEELFQLWMDVDTLFRLRDEMEQDSLRVAEIDAGLRDFTVIVDFELPREEMLASVRAGRERLRPLLACVNGSTAPTMYAFGHSHIDVAWLWPLAETERKCTRTFGTQLALLDEYPEYKFLQSQPHLYWMVKNQYPDLYARVKQAIAEGRIIPEGGMWVEADTNISGGESLIRQFLYGKRFFRDEFGVESELLWLPDVFGYTGALPQILRGCGINYFSTAKIYWSYNGGDPFPHVTFTWEGIDGSEVLTSLCYNYNAQTHPSSIYDRWKNRPQKDGITSRLYPFGYGDGGGGANRTHLEYLRRERNLEGLPQTRIESPVVFFKDLEASGIPDARYVGELYFQAHRGTYSSQAKTKRGNRKSEFALREAEMWGVAAGLLSDYAFPKTEIDDAWRAVLLNQFHDIIPGSSIHRVYEEAEQAYAAVIETVEEIAGTAAAALTDDSSATTVFNSLSWERTVLLPLTDSFTGVANAANEPIPLQHVDGETLVEVVVPACGWTTVRPASSSAAVADTLKATPHSLENELIRVLFNERGEITSLFDKESGQELASGPCNSLKMYKDVPTDWDAWDIDSTYVCVPVALAEPAEIEVVTAGPLVATLRVTRKLHQSPMTQEISLRRGSRQVDFATTIDWQESHKMLKVNFPVQYHASEAVQEIQFGHIRRPNHKSRPFDADRFEVANHKWTALTEENRGFAVLNDCKYGVNVLDNSINLTLLRSPLAPDMTADKGLQQFAYACYAWNGSLADSAVVRNAYELNSPALSITGAAGERSLFALDAANIVIDTVKPAEDGSGAVIVRLYESKRTATRCALTTTLPVREAEQTNMLEVVEGPLPCSDGTISLDFRAFEVKTIRLTV